MDINFKEHSLDHKLKEKLHEAISRIIFPYLKVIPIKELAKRMGITYQELQAVMNGKQEPSDRLLKLIAIQYLYQAPTDILIRYKAALSGDVPKVQVKRGRPPKAK